MTDRIQLHNSIALPGQSTNFVGREQQIHEVNRLLASTRLLTLTGAGGCGKTRLALRLPSDVSDAYPDGVWLVELAALTDSALVAQALAQAVGVPEVPGRTLTDSLVEHLRERASLLILDNCEHVIDAAAHVADALLRACPGVHILATSRDDCFRLLTRGPRTAMPRQQSLLATVNWSYALLSAPERSLLTRLSIFAGGWTFEAAEAVAAGDGLQPYAVLSLLAQLVDKSLLIAQHQRGAVRYRMLEMIRQFARDRLEESDEADATRDQHLAYFLELAEEAEPKLRGPEARAVMDRLEEEHDNLRLANRLGRAGGCRRGAQTQWVIGLVLVGSRLPQ